LARVQAVKLVADFSAAVVTEEAMLGNPNVPLVKCDAYRERRMAAEAALLAALCGETTAPAAVPRDLKSGPAGDPGETK
jgi:hypothetical protein